MLKTDRLILRRWREEDREPWAAMGADPEVMRHFPALLTREQSDAAFERVKAHFEGRGFGLWAAEHQGEFIGFVGLAVPRFEAWFTPCVEIGWRLARRWWGQGLAPEGARAALRYGFEELKLEEIVAFTVPGNVQSRRVMDKIGMKWLGEEFDHPELPEGHALRKHFLYRLKRPSP